MSALQQFLTPFGTNLTVGRFPLQKRETLRAWDAADEYLLQQACSEHLENVLIINDSFGVLSCALSRFQPVAQTDSYIARWSLAENLKLNQIPEDSVINMTSLDSYRGQYDWVFMRVPKSLSALEDTLIKLKPHLTSQSRLVGAAMAKHIHTSTLALFKRIIGPTRTSLAQKKARLIFSEVDDSLSPGVSPYPSSYQLDGDGFQIYNHAAVFCREKLDIGSRFFIEHLPETEGPGRIVDLGCGNGVVGLSVAARNPEAEILFTDESYMAVESARLTFQASGLANKVSYRVGDTLEGVDPNSYDLVLCNPPFHQQTVIGDSIAWRMFKISRQTLISGGQLWVVGNRHLKYHQKLKHLFGSVEQIASNPKFVVLRSEKQA